jgi:hypothetical protein
MSYEKIVELLKSGAFVCATKFISKTERVRFKRKLSGGKIDKRDKGMDVVLTVGKPNWTERDFLKRKYKDKFPSAWIMKSYQPKKK